MAETAAHLVDHVLPWVPVRQWVLSLPFGIRFAVAYNRDLCRDVRKIFVRTVLGFLKNPKYKERIVLKCIQEAILPLRKDMDWGYSIPYAITGQLNEHPRDAIKVRSGDKRDDYVSFYDEMNE